MKFIHKIFISELFFLTIIVISTILTNITNLTFNLFENFIDESYISRYFISVLIIFLSHLLLARYFFKKFSYKINLDLVLIVLFINYLLFYVLSIVLIVFYCFSYNKYRIFFIRNKYENRIKPWNE
jgi:hypothetical protein